MWLLLRLFMGYGAFHAVFFGPVLFSSSWLAIDDSITNFVPDFAFPPTLWSDYGAGYAISTDPAAMTWSPTKLIGQLLLMLGVTKAYDIHVVSAYVFASVFAHSYIHHLTRSHVAGIIGGLIYGLGSFMISKVELPFLAQAAAWLPLLALGLDRLRDRFHTGWFAAVALATALTILAGHPQGAAYSLLVTATLGVTLGWRAPVGRWRYCAVGLAAGLTGIGLAGIQVLPTLAAHPLMGRTEWSYDAFLSNALPVKHLFKLLFPFLFGGSASKAYGVDYFGGDDFGETSVYLGILPLGLALLGLRSRESRSATGWFWATWVVLSIMFAIGDATPVAKIGYQLPIIGSARCPGRIFFVLNLGMAVLAGFGTAALHRRTVGRRTIVLTVAVLVAIIVGAFASALALEDVLRQAPGQTVAGKPFWPTQNLATAVPLLLVAAAAVALGLFSVTSGWMGPAAMALLIAITVVDLGSFSWFMEWKYKTAEPTREFGTPLYAVKYRDLLKPTHQRILTFGGHRDAVSGLLPDRSRLWGLESVNVRRAWAYGRLLAAFLDRKSEDLLAHPVGFDLFAIRYVLVMVEGEPEGLPPGPDSLAPALMRDPERWRLVDRFGISWVFENQRALPRTWLVQRTIPATNNEMLTTFRTGQLPDGSTFDPRRVALVAGDVQLEAADFDPSSSRATIVERRSMSTTIRTENASPAFLVLSDNHFPGWQAEIDGEPVRVHRANYLQRGVVVPAGRHVVRFSYRPLSFTLGATLTAASAAGLVLLLAMTRWRTAERGALRQSAAV